MWSMLQAARMDLISNKQRLEQDIRVKENSLKIDQQKCMTLRYSLGSVRVNDQTPCRIRLRVGSDSVSDQTP